MSFFHIHKDKVDVLAGILIDSYMLELSYFLNIDEDNRILSSLDNRNIIEF